MKHVTFAVIKQGVSRVETWNVLNTEMVLGKTPEFQ
jgi:hypothetical protein